MHNKYIQGRAIQKHDIEKNWLKAVNFIPMAGEIVVYDRDDNILDEALRGDYSYARVKIGDGIRNVNDLPFIQETIESSKVICGPNLLLSDILEAYVLNIDYNSTLAFDTSEVIFGTNSSAVLGQAILGQMVLT